jgi:phage shock protein C
MDTARKVYRSSSHKVFGGVASGLADYFGVDVVVMRIIWGLLVFLGIGVPLYLLCWVAIPREPVITINGFTIETESRSNAFGTFVKIVLMLCFGAIVVSEFDRDVAVIAFLVGLALGLYYLWRNRRTDDEPSAQSSRFHRSESNRRILGVFGGLGDTFNVDPTLLRIVGGVVLVAGFPVIVPLYLLYAMIVPTRRMIAV